MAWQRKTPFGYMIRSGETVTCPVEADAVRGIFTRYLAGASYAKIAEEMSRGSVPYHRHTAQWNKHMVKRILENGKYLGTDIYPRLVSDEDFLAVQLQREDKTDYAPCPASLNLIREKAVCAACGGRIARNTKSHGHPRWVCANPNCGAIVRIDDDAMQERVSERLRQLTEAPDLLTPPRTPEPVPSADTPRIQNELNLSFNRADLNPDYIKSLIFAIASERYNLLTDPTPAHELELLRERLEHSPASEKDLRELLTKAVKAIRVGGQGYIELELVNGQIIGKEQPA